MKRIIVGITIVLGLALITSGCGQQSAQSSKEAIETSKQIETAQEKANYLLGQAQTFYKSKKFQDTVDVAQHILLYLDRDSQQAKDLLQKAKDMLIAQAKTKMEEAQKNLPSF